MSALKRVKLSEDVRVELGDTRSYNIVFSPISSLAAALEEAGFPPKGKCVLVSNSVVGQTRHKQVAFDSLKSAGWNVSYVEFPDGELKKTRVFLARSCTPVTNKKRKQPRPILSLSVNSLTRRWIGRR